MTHRQKFEQDEKYLHFRVFREKIANVYGLFFRNYLEEGQILSRSQIIYNRLPSINKVDFEPYPIYRKSGHINLELSYLYLQMMIKSNYLRRVKGGFQVTSIPFQIFPDLDQWQEDLMDNDRTNKLGQILNDAIFYDSYTLFEGENLISLSLNKMEITSNDFFYLCMIKNLEFLNIEFKTIETLSLDVKTIFDKLRILVLKGNTLPMINTSDFNNFPKLEYLIVRGVKLKNKMLDAFSKISDIKIIY